MRGRILFNGNMADPVLFAQRIRPFLFEAARPGHAPRVTLVTAAWAAVRVKTSYLRAQFLRIKARRGAKKAILAVAASMLTAVYHMLRDGTEYNDLGSEHFDRQDRSKPIRRLIKRLQDLGCDVPLTAHES